MIEAEQLAESFALNLRVIKMQAAGLTTDDSLRQPPVRGNCINWVLGHIAENRLRVLRALGEDPVAEEGTLIRYASESEPVTASGEGVLALEQLLDTLERAQAGIAAGLARATPEALAREVPVGERATTVGRQVFFLYFHEAYHVGQLELLRQLAGTNDKVI
jgi:hypothetical protein